MLLEAHELMATLPSIDYILPATEDLVLEVCQQNSADRKTGTVSSTYMGKGNQSLRDRAALLVFPLHQVNYFSELINVHLLLIVRIHENLLNIPLLYYIYIILELSNTLDYSKFHAF